MKRNKSIQFKAGLLLIVFSLNTVIGFACSVGMDMGFNSTHHQCDASFQPVQKVTDLTPTHFKLLGQNKRKPLDKI